MASPFENHITGRPAVGPTVVGPATARRDEPLVPAGPLAALILGALAMGLSPVFVRIALPEVGPLASAFWRAVLALPALYAWMRIEGGSTRAWPASVTWFAGLAFTGDLLFWHLAIRGTSVANATFFATTAPVFVVLATWLLLGRAVGRGTVGGLLLCLAGGAALVVESAMVAPGRLVGDAEGVITAVFFGSYVLLAARARAEGIGPGRLSFQSTAVTAACLLVVALIGESDRFWPSSPSVWAALLALALISQAAGQGLLAVALGRLPAMFSSLVIFLEAVFAAAAGWLFLGEAVSGIQAAGGALILFGIWIARPRAGAAAA